MNSHERYEDDIKNGPQLQWFEIKDPEAWSQRNCWIYQDGTIRVQIAKSNIDGYKCLISNVCNGVRITGPSWTTENLDFLKKLCEQEIKYFKTIIIPDRDITNLGSIKEQNERAH